MLSKLVSNIDASMRRRQGIFEFCEDEDCIFRLKVTTAGEAPALVDAGLPADARVLELHFWNERLPELPLGGPDLAWANRARRATVSSLKKIAAYIQSEPDLQDITMCFGPETELLLTLMALSLAASILSAIMCLHPRLHAERGKTESMLKDEIGKRDQVEPIPARLSWFFGYLAQLDQERVARQLQNVDDLFAAEALAHEAAKFSRNVLQKHSWADRAFLFAGSSLVFLLLAAASYWWRIASSSCTLSGGV